MRQEDDRGGPQDSGKAQEPEGSAEKAGSKKDKYQKAQAKAEHAGEKLGKAREKLDKVEAKRAAQKPPGLAKKAVRGARTEAWFYLHNKIHEVEHENVGVEGAHKSELTAEAGTRKLTRYAKRRWREHPARKVAKWERKDIKARANVDFQKMAAEHPELASNPLSRIQQKWKLKRRYSKEAKAAAKQSAKAAKKAGDENATASALQIDDEPCAVMLSATGLIARTSEDAVERWENRSASDGRAKDDQIVSMFRTSTRSSYGLVTSAGRLVLAHVVELPKVSADGPLSVTGGVKAEELLGMTENTDPIRGERVIAAIDMPSTDDGGQLVPLALGTRNGVVKRWNRESPTTMDSWSVIDLKDDDEVLAAAEARDEDRLVFVSTDSSLLTFEAKNVRPQGRTAGGMAGIRLAEGCSVAAFAVVPDGKVTWNYEEGENGLFSASGAVVLTVAGDSEALPGTENGAAKVTPLEMYPTKGRGTGGVRSQRFLKGQDTLILAFVGAYPLHASTQSGAPVELPKPDMRRDGSGTDLSAPIAVVG